MEEKDQEEDTAFLEEQERVNRFARCSFEDCFCDGEQGKLVCFGVRVDGAREVWKCRRFDVAKLKSDSAMRMAYEDLVGGVFP